MAQERLERQDMGNEERSKELKELRKRSRLGGGPDRMEKHRKQGKADRQGTVGRAAGPR